MFLFDKWRNVTVAVTVHMCTGSIFLCVFHVMVSARFFIGKPPSALLMPMQWREKNTNYSGLIYRCRNVWRWASAGKSPTSDVNYDWKLFFTSIPCLLKQQCNNVSHPKHWVIVKLPTHNMWNSKTLISNIFHLQLYHKKNNPTNFINLKCPHSSIFI